MSHPQKKRRHDLSVVDEQLLLHRENRKLFKAVAYGFGIGLGFLILSPLLPDIGNKEKSDAMIAVFNRVAIYMIAYAGIITFSFFFLRAHMKLVLFILNWLVLPTVGLWAFMEGYKVLTSG